MDYLLICEGRCNPLIAHIDAAVAALPDTRHMLRDGPEARGDESLWAAQRQLRYTRHFRVTPMAVICRECGNIRQWETAE